MRKAHNSPSYHNFDTSMVGAISNLLEFHNGFGIGQSWWMNEWMDDGWETFFSLGSQAFI